MKWYYKYLPYFLLERKLNREDDFNAPTVKYINDKEISMILLEIEKGVWIGQNEKEYLLRRKKGIENKIEEMNDELRRVESELSKMD